MSLFTNSYCNSNLIRSNLIQEISKELRHIKKSSKTKVNSKTIKDAEQFFDTDRDNICNMKSEFFCNVIIFKNQSLTQNKYEQKNSLKCSSVSNSTSTTLDEKLELINISSNFMKNEKTKKRCENGFNFLQNLAEKLKKNTIGTLNSITNVINNSDLKEDLKN
jgi:hypothetical protein